jgi:hypothetical protein
MSLGLIPRFSSQNLGFRVKEISGKMKRDHKIRALSVVIVVIEAAGTPNRERELNALGHAGFCGETCEPNAR